MSKFNIGDKVKYIGKDHNLHPQWYPALGTIGKVIDIREEDREYKVQWTKGSTSKKDQYWCGEKDIEKIEDTITKKEIWEMLKPKMEKNGLTSNIYSCVKVDDNGFPCFFLEEVYKNNDVHNAIALAYKVGYLRAMKGRPFKFGEKKKGGHWEPVDPNNLPKEGTKVRYSREYKGYNWLKDSLCIGTKGTLTIDGPYSRIGMMLDRPTSFLAWADFEDEEAIACLDMWVEDDE